jgi:hypothetical protein
VVELQDGEIRLPAVRARVLEQERGEACLMLATDAHLSVADAVTVRHPVVRVPAHEALSAARLMTVHLPTRPVELRHALGDMTGNALLHGC